MAAGAEIALGPRTIVQSQSKNVENSSRPRGDDVSNR
jgi:hypothetical protein